MRAVAILAIAAAFFGCGSDPAEDEPDTCELIENTTATATMNEAGCLVLDRDTSSCEDSRTAAGLSGLWLKFSCRVTLSMVAGHVRAHADGQPDYLSNYFPATHRCHEEYDEAIQNPNTLRTQNYTIDFPVAPDTNSGPMMGAIVGLSLNGVPIFGNFAAPGDDIFQEAMTFDRCGAHPQMTGVYHYHGEPAAISYDDSRLIGVMRDGYPVYGRRDPDDQIPTVDADGGHTGVTVDSPSVATYHYHLNLQTSTDPRTVGQMQWFLTTGNYHGTPAATCTGC